VARFATVIATAAMLAAAATGVALAQKAPPPIYTPAADAEMGLNLYPTTKFRGAPEVLTQDNPRIRRPIAAESAIVLRGVWEVCSEINYGGRCIEISETRQGFPVALQVRSARLVGDNGANYADSPVPKGKTLVTSAAAVEAARPAPATIAAPSVASGGLAGENPSLKGQGVEFFAAPARGGSRILACASGGNSGRCVTGTADAFCAEKGYRDSSMRDIQMVGGKSYLSNVVCKNNSDPNTNGDVKTKGFFGLGR
jgi:hypothetical protein